MARASRGGILEKSQSTFAVRLCKLMNKKPSTTQAQLAEITGKTRQTVSQYANGISEPGYETLVKIADYFQVSIDYLLGRTNDPNIQKSAVDELGISPNAIKWLKIFVKNDVSDFDYADTSSVFNHLFEDEYSSFSVFFHELCCYFNAKRAEYIYEALLEQSFPSYLADSDSISDTELFEFNCKIKAALKEIEFPNEIPENAKRENYLPHEIADYLEAIIELEDSEPGDSNFLDVMQGLYDLRISELPDFRARKAFEGILRNLDNYAENEGSFENIPECLRNIMR